jgi:hypothetical protein
LCVGAGEVAASSFLLADRAPFGCRLAAELDDGVVVEAVAVGEVAASAVVGVSLGVFLGCAGPAVAVGSTLRRPSNDRLPTAMSEPRKASARSVRIVSVAMGNDRNDGLPDRLPHVVPGARAARRGPRETVKRHPALVPLSEQHHHELAHARRLLRAAGVGPEERLAVASAYVDAFFTETVGHFRREEEILFPLYVRHAGSTPVLERILREHMELHGLVRALRAEAAAGDIAPEALRTLGGLLHDHVRVEERELFEEIERIVPAAELEGVKL